MSLVKIRGVDLFYELKPGDGGSLVFIHGSGGNHKMWSGQMDLGLNCVALDMPGHGQSGGQAASSISEAAAWVVEFLAQMNLPRPLYLVGHSMGAAISLTCALQDADLLDGIVLIGAGQRMKVLPAFLDSLRAGLSDPGFFKLGFSPSAPLEMVTNMVKTIAAVSPSVLYADFSACNNFDVSQELEGIKLPTLLIVGIDDKLTPLKLAQYINAHISGSRLEIIAEAGHFVMLEQPAQVNQLITDFCS